VEEDLGHILGIGTAANMPLEFEEILMPDHVEHVALAEIGETALITTRIGDLHEIPKIDVRRGHDPILPRASDISETAS